MGWHCCKAVDTGGNMTGQVLISWSISSGVSHQEATAGMGEGDGEGCEPTWKSPSHASQRLALNTL